MYLVRPSSFLRYYHPTTNPPDRHSLHHEQHHHSSSFFDSSTRSTLTRYHGLLSSLPRSPTPATTVASRPRSKHPSTISTSSSTIVDDTKHHNACRQLPSVPGPTTNSSSATSAIEMRACVATLSVLHGAHESGSTPSTNILIFESQVHQTRAWPS